MPKNGKVFWVGPVEMLWVALPPGLGVVVVTVVLQLALQLAPELALQLAPELALQLAQELALKLVLELVLVLGHHVPAQ